MTAYREGPGEQRLELLAKRDALLEAPVGTFSVACRAELDGLRGRLETADHDPLDHVEEGLRLYGMALEAARAAGEQRAFRRRWNRAAAGVILGSLLAVVVGRLGYQYADHEFLVNPCSNERLTGQHHEVVRHDGMLGIEFRCEALSDADCEEPCAREGACEAVDGRCVPRTDAHCEQSEICSYHGECERQGDICVAGSIEDCRSSEGCRQDGVCSYTGRRCAPRSDGDCKASARCREDGFCRLGFSGCVQEHAPVVDDCVRMAHCVESGLCTRDEMPEGCILRGSATASSR